MREKKFNVSPDSSAEKLKTLISKISPAGIEIQSGRLFTVIVSREDWNNPKWSYGTGPRLKEVWQWDGKAFTYQAKLSTTKPGGEILLP